MVQNFQIFLGKWPVIKYNGRSNRETNFDFFNKKDFFKLQDVVSISAHYWVSISARKWVSISSYIRRLLKTHDLIDTMSCRKKK